MDAGCIVVRVNDAETEAGEPGVDIYNPTKYTSFQSEHCINQRCFAIHVDDIVARGDVPADVWSTDLGDGAGICYAFMPGTLANRGPILIPKRVVVKTASPPSTLRKLSRVARDTPLGPEITADIPNVGESAGATDEAGIKPASAPKSRLATSWMASTPKGEPN